MHPKSHGLLIALQCESDGDPAGLAAGVPLMLLRSRVPPPRLGDCWSEV